MLDNILHEDMNVAVMAKKMSEIYLKKYSLNLKPVFLDRETSCPSFLSSMDNFMIQEHTKKKIIVHKSQKEFQFSKMTHNYKV